MLETTLEIPLDCKEIKPVNPKGNQSWIFVGRMMVKLKLQSFGHLMQSTDSLEKTLILGKIEGRRRGWQEGHEFEKALGNGERQESLVCCSPWGHKESDTTEWLNKFIGRTDAEADSPIIWPPDVKSWLIGKVPDSGKDWRQEEKGMTEDEMVGRHHWLNGHESEQALGEDGKRQGSLMCCSPWGCKEWTLLRDWTTTSVT